MSHFDKRVLIGYGNVTRLNDDTRRSTIAQEDGTEPGIRLGSGIREAITTEVKVAGVITSDIKAKEKGGACECVRWRRTNGGGRKRRRRR
jgi:hypothetical protein